jgi:hypothetical protein
MAAVRELAHAMVRDHDKENLAFTGYPAEMGLYLTLLRPPGLHRATDARRFGFSGPDESKAGKALKPVWKILKDAPETTLEEVYSKWAARPFGMKRGAMPIIALAYILSQRDRIAVYVDDLFQTTFDAFFVDKLLQNPASVRFKPVMRSVEQSGFLADIAARLDLEADSSSLKVAKRLFQKCYELPLYAQRTTNIPAEARVVRDHILKANDPEALLFNGLGSLALGADPARAIVRGIIAAEEAYPEMLQLLRAALAEALGVDARTFAGVSHRAATVIGLTNDLRFDAFAGRVAAFEEGKGEIEGLASLLVHKPPHTWSDRDREQALLELARFGRRFRETEALAAVRQRKTKTEAFAMIVGLDARTPAVLTSFELTDNEKTEARAMAQQVLKTLDAGSARSSVRLGALMRAVTSLAGDTTPESL